jgi:signal transduction histidine kinase
MTDMAATETRRRSDGYQLSGDVSSLPTLSVARDGQPGPVRYVRVANPSQRTALPEQHRPSPRAPVSSSSPAQRLQLERDLHDGVQSELVALIVRLALAKRDPRTPLALADELAELEARAQGALDSVRHIASGIYPPLLSDFGLRRALQSQAARAPIPVSVAGNAPRSTEAAEEAVYFSCSEAIQNAAKHAGAGAEVKLRLRHQDGTLAASIADNGRGFDPGDTPGGAGLRNIRGRVEDLGGIFTLASMPGHGTVLTLSLPWPAAPGGRR